MDDEPSTSPVSFLKKITNTISRGAVESADDPPLPPHLWSRWMEVADLRVEDLMTPRTVIEAVDMEVSLSNLSVDSLKHSLLPVYLRDLDNILGFVERDHLITLKKACEKDVLDSEDLIAARAVRVDQNLGSAMEEFVLGQVSLLVVKNELQQILGLLSLKDVLEVWFGVDLSDRNKHLKMQGTGLHMVRNKVEEYSL